MAAATRSRSLIVAFASVRLRSNGLRQSKVAHCIASCPFRYQKLDDGIIILRSFSDAGGDDGPKRRSTKVKKKEKKSKASEGDGGKNMDLILAALDAPERKEPPISAEERARRHEIGRNYVIGRFQEHNELGHDLSCKIKMKLHAVKMLPKDSRIKEEALKIDDEGPPPWRNIPVWTPPIPGFDPMQFAGKEEE